ncbi:hypothetical protein B0T16DRAFT_322291 [Cercophora newfieldiana]|uniref:BZIP domain-containing protein n=1 Tax=Cercophora newfieldiana TaxID=92897 RepID=A0AA39YGS8_9PEZI|nr:hypothetical protein B0T16DRAFT_322291 [Cercophora newfieldiana]
MATAATSPRNGGLVPDDSDASLELSLSLLTSQRNSPSAPSTPASVASPTAFGRSCPTPQIAIRPTTATGLPPTRGSAGAVNMATMDSPSASGPLTMTTKEWVIPPRPKPGRKPATDTPPTKRKAQNRAAQRAFRERRAARVGELEEQLDEQKEAHDRVVREMQDRITHLEVESQTLQTRCQWLEAMLEKERSARNEMSRNGSMVSAQIQSHSQQAQIVQPQEIPRTLPPSDSFIVAEPRPSAQSFSISQIISPPESADAPLDLTCGNCHATGPCACADQALQDADIPIGCGGCTLGSRCACLEESIKAQISADLKRPRSPGSPLAADKRQRSDAGLILETDFTAMFATPMGRGKPTAPAIPEAHQPVQTLESVEPKESCGFCKDGTYCVCADAASSSMNVPPLHTSQPMAQQTHTPPPSENDVVPIPMEVTATGAIKLPGFQSFPRVEQPRPKATGGCGPNGPGTCAQCLADPKSGLFCRSLAANFERNNRQQQGPSGGCCGNGGPGGCCKAGNADAGSSAASTIRKTDAPAAASGSGLGLSLSCADAYKTLASHRHFDEAADDIGSWLPKLRAVPIPPESARGGGIFHGHSHVTAGRAPIEVEAASIMSVLKGFDVRFGRGE